MLIKLTELQDTDISRLMAIYIEGNRENAAWFYPELPEAEGIRRAEQDFVTFLRADFFTRAGSVYYVWEEAGQWVAALRLERTADGYYLEALETRPDQRRKGYGAGLLRAACRDLEREGPIRMRDCVRKTNESSLRTHLAAGFCVDQDPAIEYPGGKIDDRSYGMLYKTDAM